MAVMFIKTFAVLAVLSGTALPLSALAIHTVIEAKIPVCKPERPASEPLCVEPITGLKFVHPSAQT